ncbi:hypothetical protein HDK90DRAFT_494081 [Phyllosticta capitalensis]|uniref:Uncharacterized protein n=1 Tax=Phyllosticta capitalensis TaxID=121624 RepID=A0ABR1YFK6_9PEZI
MKFTFAPTRRPTDRPTRILVLRESLKSVNFPNQRLIPACPHLWPQVSRHLLHNGPIGRALLLVAHRLLGQERIILGRRGGSGWFCLFHSFCLYAFNTSSLLFGLANASACFGLIFAGTGSGCEDAVQRRRRLGIADYQRRQR